MVLNSRIFAPLFKAKVKSQKEKVKNSPQLKNFFLLPFYFPTLGAGFRLAQFYFA